MTLRDGFLWGASTSAYQVEGGNTKSEWWSLERMPNIPLEKCGDAVDHYHRYPEDMKLLADAGLNSYRFSLEWARIEPERGEFSLAQLDHYRRMIDTARDTGLEPVVTLHHFSNPQWLAADGGWLAQGAPDRYLSYVEKASEILEDVDYVCTINEPNMLAVFIAGVQGEGLSAGQLPAPSEKTGELLIQTHHRAFDILKAKTDANVGWTVAQQALTATPGNEELHRKLSWQWEDMYLDAARHDDFVGSQAYTSQLVDEKGIVPHPPHPDNTDTGWAYRPDALGIAVRNAHKVAGGIPIIVTENGIATHDDERRIAYTKEALQHMQSAADGGIDIRGYFHWSALDNYEWGQWGAPFGLIGVDRQTFTRTPRPSLAWLGNVARTNDVTA